MQQLMETDQALDVKKRQDGACDCAPLISRAKRTITACFARYVDRDGISLSTDYIFYKD